MEEAEGRDGWDTVSHRARPGRERERQRMRLKEAGETEDEDWGQGLRTRRKQVTDGGHRGKTELGGAGGWKDGPGAREEELGPKAGRLVTSPGASVAAKA